MNWRKWATAALLFAIAGIAWLSIRAEGVSGDEFRILVMASDSQSSASWYLYSQSEDAYCFKYSRPIVPKRYCVPKRDLEVKNGPNGKSKVGYVYKDQFVLKANRFPGATGQVF